MKKQAGHDGTGQESESSAGGEKEASSQRGFCGGYIPRREPGQGAMIRKEQNN